MELYLFGRWIYYDKVSGEILHETGEVKHPDPEYEVKRDPFQYVTKLMDRSPESVGVLKLNPGDLKQDFHEGELVRVNPETHVIEFTYTDPNTGETLPPQPPMSLQLESLKTDVESLKTAVDELILGGGL